MFKTYRNLDLNRIENTDKELNQILNDITCFQCEKVPIPLYRTHEGNKSICYDCIKSKSIDGSRAKQSELRYLNIIRIKCKNECGTIFDHPFLDLTMHESECKFEKSNQKDNLSNENKEILKFIQGILLSMREKNELSQLFFSKINNSLNSFGSFDDVRGLLSVMKQGKSENSKIYDNSKLVKEMKEKLTNISKNYNSEIIKSTDNFYHFKSLIDLTEKSIDISSYQSKIIETSFSEMDLSENYKKLSQSIIAGNVKNFFKREHRNRVYSMVIYNINEILTLITGSYDGELKFWDFKKRKCLWNIEKAHDKNITSLITANGFLISCSRDGYLKFWNLNADNINEAHHSHDLGTPIYSMINHNDSYIFVSGSDTDKTIYYYEIESYSIKKKIITNHNAIIGKLLIFKTSHVGPELLITGCWDSTIKVFNLGENYSFEDEQLEGGTILDSYHKWKISSMISLQNPDQDKIVTADTEGNIVFWKFDQNFQLLKKIIRTDYEDKALSYQFLTNLMQLNGERRMISVTEVSSITFWDLESLSIIRTLKLKYQRYPDEGIINMIDYELENEKGIIFSIYKDLVIWN